ncbi:MAG: hypothetical protein WDW36_000147 [Sanguina aurantia]
MAVPAGAGAKELAVLSPVTLRVLSEVAAMTWVFADGVSTNQTFSAWHDTLKAQAHALATLKRLFVPSKLAQGSSPGATPPDAAP